MRSRRALEAVEPMHGDRHVVERKAVDQHPCRILALLQFRAQGCKAPVLEFRKAGMYTISRGSSQNAVVVGLIS